MLSAAGEGDAASSGVGEAAGLVSLSVLVLLVDVFLVDVEGEASAEVFLVVEVFFSVDVVAVDFFAGVDDDFFVDEAW